MGNWTAGVTLVYTMQDYQLTDSERDSTNQLIGPIDTVIEVVDEIVRGVIDWEGAGKKLQSYSGVQDVE